jgi:hypothetical protein
MSCNDRKCDEMRFTHLKIYYGLERTLRGLFRCTRTNCASLPSCKTSRRWRSEPSGLRTHHGQNCLRARGHQADRVKDKGHVLSDLTFN